MSNDALCLNTCDVFNPEQWTTAKAFDGKCDERCWVNIEHLHSRHGLRRLWGASRQEGSVPLPLLFIIRICRMRG